MPGFTRTLRFTFVLCAMMIVALPGCRTVSAEPASAETSPDDPGEPSVERDVAAFLESKRDDWMGNSVPFDDGRVLHDMVLETGATSILEIGTSQGHSTLWLAWAARQTGGTVTSIEIDPALHADARANLEAAGLLEHVELILGDAHAIVPTLDDEFAFVFSDADKDGYITYFEAIRDNIPPGGCIAAHNALNGFAGVDRYIEHVRGQSEFETRIERSSPSGFAISCKRAE